MDPTIVVAAIGLIGGTITSYFKIKEVVAARQTASNGAPSSDAQWFIEELKADRAQARRDVELAKESAEIARKHAAKCESDMELSQSQRQNDLFRIDFLERGRERDQLRIRELESEVRTLKGIS